MRFVLLTGLFTMLMSASDCKSGKQTTELTGKLEIKGICSNYTISLQSGKLDRSLITAQWTDEVTGKEYTDVFGINNPCSFPDSIKEGDSFKFTVLENDSRDCIVCEAYYPTPAQKLNIRVIKLISKTGL